jgi:hypothetical protein
LLNIVFERLIDRKNEAFRLLLFDLAPEKTKMKASLSYIFVNKILLWEEWQKWAK